MVIPYVLAVSCVVIASAYMFHGQPYDGLLEEGWAGGAGGDPLQGLMISIN